MKLLNTFRPRSNCRQFADNIGKYIFLKQNLWIPLKISQKFLPKIRINNMSALVQIAACCRTGDKPLSELLMVSSRTHLCVTRPQWVKPMGTDNNIKATNTTQRRECSLSYIVDAFRVKLTIIILQFYWNLFLSLSWRIVCHILDIWKTIN